MRTNPKAIVSSMRLGDILTNVEEKKLILKPYFQRRLVWTSVVKEAFLDTVLGGFPFPEIFVAVGAQDDETRLKRTQWLVDGQQRISTLRQYVIGAKDLVLKNVRPYAELSPDEKGAFSDYSVAVRDLGAVSDDEIREIFRRINSADYSLKAIERLNAMYSGAFKTYCEALTNHKFFQSRGIFTTSDFRRMRDLDFCIILVVTMMSTYFNRDEQNAEYLKRYNDEFPEHTEISGRLETVFSFIKRCGLEKDSRAWKKTDLLTLLVELDAILNRTKKADLNARAVGRRLNEFYAQIDGMFRLPGDTENYTPDHAKYLKAATKATNDKYSRDFRAEVVQKAIFGELNVDEAKVPSAPKTSRATKLPSKKRPSAKASTSANLSLRKKSR